MDNVTNVTPIPMVWTQSRHTKLGMATVTIRPEGDLTESTVTISYGSDEKQQIFRAEGIFSSVREAFLWAYGVKQTRNDRYAGYTAKDGNLIETKPAKSSKIAEVISIRDALIESQSDYDNFDLRKANVSSDKVSLASVKASTLLSDDEKALMASLFAKLGKVSS